MILQPVSTEIAARGCAVEVLAPWATGGSGGLRWAVLSAYARSLPHGPERYRARLLAERNRPARCGPALVLAEALGLTRRANITPKGLQAVRRYLALHRVAA